MRFSEEIARIQRMNLGQLLDYVIANPHYLCDRYYGEIALAIKQHRVDLKRSRPSASQQGN